MSRLCLYPNCEQPRSSGSAWYCPQHSYDTVQAHSDWRDNQKRDLHLYFTPTPKPLYDGEDDWRLDVLGRSFLPRKTRLLCSENAT
jgi:hypothetical protein